MKKSPNCASQIHNEFGRPTLIPKIIVKQTFLDLELNVIPYSNAKTASSERILLATFKKQKIERFIFYEILKSILPLDNLALHVDSVHY